MMEGCVDELWRIQAVVVNLVAVVGCWNVVERREWEPRGAGKSERQERASRHVPTLSTHGRPPHHCKILPKLTPTTFWHTTPAYMRIWGRFGRRT
jgi:hypothetical protein